MAVYEYECPSCGEKFEVRRGLLTLRKNEKCPKCGSSETRRVYSSFCGGRTERTGDSCAPRSFG